MKAEEFGGWKWKAQNIIGQDQRKIDEYNTFLKKERHPDPPEYASRDVEEYKQFSETKDQSNQQAKDRAKQDGSEGSGSSANGRGRMRSNMFRQVVGLVAGSAVLVGTYQAMEAQQAAAQEQEPTEIEEQVEPSGTEESIPEESKSGPGGSGESQVPDTPGGSEESQSSDPSQEVTPTEEVDPCEVNGHTYEELGTTNADGKITIHYRCSGCGEEKELVITYNIEPEE